MMKTLIFDWDGTIHNTKHLYGCAFRKVYQTLVENGYAEEHYYSDDDMAGYLGMTGPVMWKTFMPSLPEEIRTKASIQISHALAEYIPQYSVLYPDAEKTLDTLKEQGYHMVYLSNSRHVYMEANRKRWQLDRWFDAFYCSEDFGFIPKENIFPEIEKNFPGPYAVIGDRSTDLSIARVHGIASIGCAYGFGTMEELSCADRIAYTISELPDLLKQISI